MKTTTMTNWLDLAAERDALRGIALTAGEDLATHKAAWRKADRVDAAATAAFKAELKARRAAAKADFDNKVKALFSRITLIEAEKHML